MSFSNGRPNGDWRMMPPPPRPSQPRGGGGGGGRGFISRGGNHGAGGAFRHNNNNHRYQDRIMPPPMNRHNNANVTRNIRWIPPPNHRNGSPHQQHNHRKRDGPFEGGGNYHHHQQRKRHCPLSRLKDNNSSAAASNNGTNAPATMPPPMRIKTESNRTNQTVTQRQGNHNRNHQRSNGRSSYTNNNAFMALAAPYRVKVEQRETNSSRTMTTNATATTNPAVRQEEEKKEEDPEIVDLVDSDEDEEERNPQAINSSRTHIIFTIDFSGSMNTKDVATKDQGKVRRYDAVFECIKGFLEEQLAASNDNDNNSSQAVVSVLIFNQQAQTLLNRMPLVGDGQKVLKALRTAQKLHDKPKGGTGFSAGFQRAKELAAADTVGTNVMVVFLSDGRPGDLKKSPPDANIPMQNTYRSHKKEYPAAGQHIEAMKQLHGGRFSLQLICLFDEGKPVSIYTAVLVLALYNI